MKHKFEDGDTEKNGIAEANQFALRIKSLIQHLYFAPSHIDAWKSSINNSKIVTANLYSELFFYIVFYLFLNET